MAQDQLPHKLNLGRKLQRLRQRLGENFVRAVDLIKSTIEARGKVIVLGVGKSGHIGEKIAATLFAWDVARIDRAHWKRATNYFAG